MATIPILDLLTEKDVEKLASRSHLRFGKQIIKNGTITITNSNMFRRIAVVKYKNNPLQTVEFLSDNKGLHYKCSCTNKKHFFCEHCAAVALSLMPGK